MSHPYRKFQNLHLRKILVLPFCSRTRLRCGDCHLHDDTETVLPFRCLCYSYPELCGCPTLARLSRWSATGRVSAMSSAVRHQPARTESVRATVNSIHRSNVDVNSRTSTRRQSNRLSYGMTPQRVPAKDHLRISRKEEIRHSSTRCSRTLTISFSGSSPSSLNKFFCANRETSRENDKERRLLHSDKLISARRRTGIDFQYK